MVNNYKRLQLEFVEIKNQGNGVLRRRDNVKSGGSRINVLLLAVRMDAVEISSVNGNATRRREEGKERKNVEQMDLSRTIAQGPANAAKGPENASTPSIDSFNERIIQNLNIMTYGKSEKSKLYIFP